VSDGYQTRKIENGALGCATGKRSAIGVKEKETNNKEKKNSFLVIVISHSFTLLRMEAPVTRSAGAATLRSTIVQFNANFISVSVQFTK